MDKERKIFFKNDDERNLWIKLNAEHIRYSQKILNNIDEEDLGDIDERWSHLWVSNNQLIYDEIMDDKPRFSLAELSGMNHDELLDLSIERNKKIIKEIFENNEEEL